MGIVTYDMGRHRYCNFQLEDIRDRFVRDKHVQRLLST